MKNEILLRRKNKVKVIISEGSSDSLNYVASIIKNIESLGYTFSKDLIDVLRTLNSMSLTLFYRNLVSDIRKMVGAHVQHRPMYPNFPIQVMEASDAELFINAFVHYLTFGQLMPDYECKIRLPLVDDVTLKIITLGTEKDLLDIGRHLLSSKTSLSATDKSDLDFLVKEYGISTLLPDKIPLKENLALVAEYVLKDKDNKTDLSNLLKTATDVLRFVVAMSDGDISLADDTRFRNFTRPERKMILRLLEGCKNREEDMSKYINVWQRIGEKIHPGEYAKQFPKTAEAFRKIRNRVKIETFNGRVQSLLNNNHYDAAVKELVKRPGEFARRLDSILRNTSNVTPVIEAFNSIADKISTPVLLQLKAHFQSRNSTTERVIFPKGNVSKAMVLENNLTEMDEQICRVVVAICDKALSEIFSKKDKLGKVYIAESLKKIMVPMNQRSASKTLRPLARGSRLPIPEGKVVRPFIYWKDQSAKKSNDWFDYDNGRVDIDLSATFYTDSWSYKDHISWTGLRNHQLNCYHSGDITSAPNGASEFIDLDLARLKQNGIRFVMVSVHSYTEQAYKDIPECFMGWMIRNEVQSGEIFEPTTVQNKIDLTGDTKIALPMILDLDTNEFIWLDLSLKQPIERSNALENAQTGIVAIGKGLTNMVKPNLFDLFYLHGSARGEIVQNKEEADIVFDFDGDVSPYDVDVIMSEYL